jgi:hypothetical protein
MQSNKDQRDFSRVGIHMEAVLTVANQEPIRGKLHDVSMSGLCIECDSNLKAGDTCHVRIELGTGESPISINAEGEVSRKFESSLAISFKSVDSDGFAHLQNLVLYNSGDNERVEQEFAEHTGIKRKQA